MAEKNLFSPDPYAAERDRISRQRKFAEVLQAQAYQPAEKFSYAGIEAPVSAAGGLAKALQMGMSGYLQADAARREDEDNLKHETDYNAANKAFIRGMTPTPGVPEVRGLSPATEADVAGRAESILQGSTAPPLRVGEPVDVLPGQGAPGTVGSFATEAIPGSYDRSITELSGLQGNPYAVRLSQNLMMRNAKVDPPSIREYQFAKGNGFSGSYEDWTAKTTPGRESMTVQEWKYFNSLSAQDQARFLTLKRANQWRDLGGADVLINPADPAGPPLNTLPKTLKPGELPNVRGKQKEAETAAAAATKLNFENYEQATAASDSINKIDYILKHLDESQAITGMGSEMIKNIERLQTTFNLSKTSGKTASDTEILESLLGSDVFPLIGTLNIGARGLDTPKERDFLVRVMTGDISMNRNTLIKLTQTRRDIAQRVVEKFNQRVNEGELETLFNALGKKPTPFAITPSLAEVRAEQERRAKNKPK